MTKSVIKTLVPADLNTTILIDITENAKGLGPAFLNRFLPSLSSIYPQAEQQLPFSKPLYLTAEGDRPTLSVRNWHPLMLQWNDWVDRVSAAKGEQWKMMGIYDLIQLSKIPFIFNRALFFASLHFWSPTTNSLHLHCGMMAPTLRDVCFLTGLKPGGDEINYLLQDEEISFYFPEQKRAKPFVQSHGPFLKEMLGEEGTNVDEQEHIGFLLLWLCRYLLCAPAIQITKDLTQLAIALLKGKPMALAPFLLASLYRGLSDLITSNFSRSEGPFWLYQFWLHAYFPELALPIWLAPNDPLLSFEYARVKPKDHSFNDCFQLFYHQCKIRTQSQFLPFSKCQLAPSWLFPRTAESSPEQIDRYITSWGHFLIARDIPCNTVAPNLPKSRTVVEFYNPTQLARQFGLTQMIPVPPHFSYNKNYHKTVDSSQLVSTFLGSYKFISLNFQGVDSLELVDLTTALEPENITNIAPTRPPPAARADRTRSRSWQSTYSNAPEKSGTKSEETYIDFYVPLQSIPPSSATQKATRKKTIGKKPKKSRAKRHFDLIDDDEVISKKKKSATESPNKTQVSSDQKSIQEISTDHVEDEDKIEVSVQHGSANPTNPVSTNPSSPFDTLDSLFDSVFDSPDLNPPEIPTEPSSDIAPEVIKAIQILSQIVQQDLSLTPLFKNELAETLSFLGSYPGFSLNDQTFFKNFQLRVPSLTTAYAESIHTIDHYSSQYHEKEKLSQTLKKRKELHLSLKKEAAELAAKEKKLQAELAQLQLDKTKLGSKVANLKVQAETAALKFKSLQAQMLKLEQNKKVAETSLNQSRALWADFKAKFEEFHYNFTRI
ncbi:uncharacterized protein LOC132278285 [Cornus florida]|uniref:uncharacterized protein LOC132278285 n=1 Tax=Cornus florida TaxID=4283 RepID=UPI0028999ABA|nr:uncharacterized protein LOC132278285 [Cornus florida]